MPESRDSPGALELPRLGPKLSDEVLTRRSALPAKPDPAELHGERVVVRPYSDTDAPELFVISDGSPVTRLGRSVAEYDPDELVWRFMFAGPFTDVSALAALHHAVGDKPDARTFVVAEATSGELLGSVTLMANDPNNLKVEIGNVWFTPAVQRSGVPAEVTHLLADHVFELGYQRFEWKCHSDNLRSRAFALRFGFRFEGIQDAHYVIKDRRRDTAWFRILADEWPAVRECS